MPSQLKTANRNRGKTTRTKPRTGTVPRIVSVTSVGPASPQVSLVFDIRVIINTVPAWSTLGLAPNVSAVSIVSKSDTTLVLDFGVDVSLLTGMTISQGNSDALSESGKPVPPGEYLV